MKSKALMIVVIPVALFGAAIAVVASLLHDGVSARARPLDWKPWWRERCVTSDSCKRPGDSESRARLRGGAARCADSFRGSLRICHANDGGGKTTLGEGLFPKPPDSGYRKRKI